MAEEKNLFVTYILWLFLGTFGVHHIYLRRDNQAFVWWSTLGGFFWLGWIRDFWRIPEYVDDANDEKGFLNVLKMKMKHRKQPEFNTSRFSGQVFIGACYGTLARLACPDESPTILVTLLVPLGINIGVYLVGHIGREKGQFTIPYIVTLATYVFFYYSTGTEPGYVNISIACSLTFTYFREWKPEAKKESKTVRIRNFAIGVVLVFALWSSFFYFNATITYQNGEKIKLTDSIIHFFKSPVWLDFKQTFWNIYREGESNHWKNFYDDVISSFDPTGERNAKEVLGVHQTASEEEIRKRYKKLVVKWHPDRYRGADKEDAQHKFIEIQQAYELLQNRIKKTSRARTASFNRSQRNEF
ncbi:dnaJ homolog subfamily C member 22-like [Clytia hemisphaerica]|uniref:dnaJ homolog subfamily C member 22-like n=1 Tax=Clytia hemisphaerica TaxID=252671 RepID=UPI0034D46749